MFEEETRLRQTLLTNRISFLWSKEGFVESRKWERLPLRAASTIGI